jgi:hypothetical protein
MTWTKMSEVPNPVTDANGNPYSGAVLKAYLPGTTTATSIAIDKDGSSPQASLTANAEGIWEVSGNEVIPHIDRKCKWGIFANATDATANTPFYMGPFDNIDRSISISSTEIVFETVAAMVASTSLSVGDHVRTLGYTAIGDGGGNEYDIVAAATGTDDGGSYIDLATHQAKGLFPGGVYNVKQWGAVGDGVTDDRLSIFNADAYGPVTFTTGTYLVNSALTLTNDCKFEKGAILKPASAIAITFQGSIDSGRYHIFDISASGSFSISNDNRYCKAIWFNVVPSTLGSENDISTELQAAINFAGDNGVVEIEPHRSSYFYHFASKVTLNYNQIGMYCVARIARFRAATDITILEQTGSKFGLYLRNLQLDNGLGAAGTNSSLVLNQSFLFHLENIYVEDAPKHNYQFVGACNSSKCISCFSENAAGGDGFNISSSSVMLRFIDCESTGSANNGFNSASGSSKYGNKWIGCTSYANKYHGFSLAGDGDEAVGCTARNNSQDTADTYSGIALAGSNTKVIGGEFLDDQGTPTQKYGVRMSNTTQVVEGISGDGNVQYLLEKAFDIELTISSGAITIVRDYHAVDTEADAASDDLDTINGGTAEQILVLRPEDSTRTVVLKDGTGNLRLAGDFTMDNLQDTITLIYDSAFSVWLEVSRSDNGA